MRLAPLALLALLATPAAGQGAGDAQAIEGVIRDQLADFAARDLPGAWAHASPMIQGIFGTPATFGEMVERGYPMVWDNASAEFLDLDPEGPALRQRVLLRDAQGRGWICLYEMVETPEGWRINGVQVLPAPELAA